MKQRHMHEYGTTDEQFARIAVKQRFNALTNENAVFHGQPISVDDVLASRMVNDPLHLLECVMPCAGASAAIVTSASRAKDLRQRPVYILGAGAGASDHDTIWQAPDITTYARQGRCREGRTRCRATGRRTSSSPRCMTDTRFSRP